jgi:hypothetical protein
MSRTGSMHCICEKTSTDETHGGVDIDGRITLI